MRPSPNYRVDSVKENWMNIAFRWIESHPTDEQNRLRKALFNECMSSLKFVLPYIQYEHVLILGGGNYSIGLNFSKSSKLVFLFNPDNEFLELTRQLNCAKDIKNLIPLEGKNLNHMPFSNGVFDLIIVNGVIQFDNNKLKNNSHIFDGKSLLEIKRILKSNGICYFAFDNPFGYDQFSNLIKCLKGKNKIKNVGKLISLFNNEFLGNQKGKKRSTRSLNAKMRMLKETGFKNSKIYTLLPCCEDFKEIRPFGVSIPKLPNSHWNLRNRIKRYFNQTALFAPSYGIVTASHRLEVPFYERLIKNIKEELVRQDPNRFNELGDINGFSVRGTQTVKIVAPSYDQKGGVVVRIPLTSNAFIRRKNAHLCLTKVHQEGTQVDFLLKKTPEPLLNGEFENIPYFVESIANGYPVGNHISNSLFETSFNDAASLIERFHGKTAVLVTMENHHYQTTFGDMMEKLSQFDPRPSSKEKIKVLSGWVERTISGAMIPLVWTHGDYKLDNCLVNSKGELTGIIDWELSRINGLPLLDLLHLWFSRRRTLENVKMPEILKDLLAGFNIKKFPHTIFENYIFSLNIKPSHLFPLTVGYWAHNIVHNIDPLKFLDPSWMKEAFYGPLEVFDGYFRKLV